MIPTQTLPLPEDIPLISYQMPYPFNNKDIGIQYLTPGLFRYIVRSYAIEMHPSEILSLRQWNEIVFLKGEVYGLAVGATNPKGGMDSHVKFVVSPQDHTYKIGYTSVPAFGIYGYRDTTIRGFQRKKHTYNIDHVLLRLITVGLHIEEESFKKIIAMRWNKFPDLTKRFTKPELGAVVQVRDFIGFVIKVKGSLIVLEDNEMNQVYYCEDEITKVWG